MARKLLEPVRSVHEIAPVFDENSRVLILGSFPSVKSREPVPGEIGEKKALLLKHHIAVWDVIESCDIVGSSDSSIKNVRPNDLRRILEAAPIEKIFANGGKAFELYGKYCEPMIGRPCEKLPSTSPANAAFSLEKLVAAWEAAAVIE